ncbi:glutaredoxin [Brevibacillus panacihumi]|uniref:Glutaredoxin n=1 Tax=Brevibacillus panacihumi TaxID=497735 RepID=A0A3M8D1N4_9BACL|nr:glutaredoxin [Brevibacillus panacihumi]RNB81942.1 glutaredoxin [Brevibacillus panacihumi]
MAKIEVFIAGTYLCEDIVKQVNEFACSKCDVVIYDLYPSNANTEMEDLAKQYGVQSVPCVVLNGNVIDVEKVKKEKRS